MKKHRFLASFRAHVGGIPASITHESSARIQGPFKDFLASQQHNQKAAAPSLQTSLGTATRNLKAYLSSFKAI